MKVGERMFPLFLKSGVRGREFRKGRERGATLVEFAGMAIVVAILIGGGLLLSLQVMDATSHAVFSPRSVRPLGLEECSVAVLTIKRKRISISRLILVPPINILKISMPALVW